MSKPGYNGKGWKSKMEKTLSTSFAASGTRQAKRVMCHAVFVSCVCNSIDSVLSVSVSCCVNAGRSQTQFFPDAAGFNSDWVLFLMDSDGLWRFLSFPAGRRNSWKQNDLSRTSRRRGTNGRRWTTGTQRHKTSMNKSYNLVAPVTLGWGWLHLCTRYEIRIQCTHFQGSQKCNFDQFWIQQSLGR